MSISIPANKMLYISDGLTKKDNENNRYISYRPLSDNTELRRRLVTDDKGNSLGCVLDVMDEKGSKVMSVGSEGGLYTAEAIVGKQAVGLDVEA